METHTPLFHPIIHSIQSEINNHIYHLILNNHTIILFFTLFNPIIKDHHIMHSTHINLLQLDGICLHIRLTNPCLSSSLQLINNISTESYIACMKLTQSMRPKKPVPSTNPMVKFDDFFDFRSSYWVTTEFLLSDFWNFMVEKIQKVLLLERPVILIRLPEHYMQHFSMTNRSPARTGEKYISFWREQVSSDSRVLNPYFPCFIGIFTSFLGKKYYWVILFEKPPLQV